MRENVPLKSIAVDLVKVQLAQKRLFVSFGGNHVFTCIVV